MEKFIFCAIWGDNEWDVHADGCQDVQRGLTLGKKPYNVSNGKKIQRIYRDSFIVEGESADKAVEYEIKELDSDFGEGTWNSNYFNIMPCTKKVKIQKEKLYKLSVTESQLVTIQEALEIAIIESGEKTFKDMQKYIKMSREVLENIKKYKNREVE